MKLKVSYKTASWSRLIPQHHSWAKPRPVPHITQEERTLQENKQTKRKNTRQTDTQYTGDRLDKVSTSYIRHLYVAADKAEWTLGSFARWVTHAGTWQIPVPCTHPTQEKLTIHSKLTSKWLIVFLFNPHLLTRIMIMSSSFTKNVCGCHILLQLLMCDKRNVSVPSSCFMSKFKSM